MGDDQRQRSASARTYRTGADRGGRRLCRRAARSRPRRARPCRPRPGGARTQGWPRAGQRERGARGSDLVLRSCGCSKPRRHRRAVVRGFRAPFAWRRGYRRRRAAEAPGGSPVRLRHALEQPGTRDAFRIRCLSLRCSGAWRSADALARAAARRDRANACRQPARRHRCEPSVDRQFSHSASRSL